LPNDAERARRRHLTIHTRTSTGCKLSGLLDPEARATIDTVVAKHAASGTCDPDDEVPCVDGEPDDEHVHKDQRSQGQRNHDALKAIGRSVLAYAELGRHNGLPATVIVTAMLQDLEAGAGQAITAGGSLMPMRDFIRLASHAYHYLLIYDKQTLEPLYRAVSIRRTERL
jgi:hypothetical protein